MKLLRNTEVLKGISVYIIISVIAVSKAFSMGSNFGAFTAALCLLFIIIHIFTTWKRYRKINDLAADIDSILHGDNHIELNSYDEGELALLQSEIYKMTVCLREQGQKLISDKVYLADSIADISHQIRTPLTSINLLVQLLSKPNLDEERRCQLCLELRQMLSRIDWLITSLLKISKLDAGTIIFNREKFTLEELINKSCAPLLVSIDLRGQTLNINASGNFIGDISWSCEAIGNIVKNCIEHTPEGGMISVTAEENPLFSEICVCDNGSGISADDLPHIFERFYKGKDSDDNSFGIGLNLARMIITNQNGTIKAENQLSGGAKFVVRFYKEVV